MNRFLGGVLTITSFIAAARAADTAASRPAPEGLAKGLVAHYSFDGDVRDASGRGNHGQIKGRVRFVPGVIGKAARFGGRAEPGYVLVPNSKSLQFQRGFSIACWVRILDVGRRARVGERRHEDHHVFVAKSADPAGFYFHAHYGYWSKPPVGLGADNNKPTKTSVLAVTDKLEREWMHVAAVSDAHGLRLYFDGKRVKTAEKPVDFAAANSQLMYIGRQGNASPFPLNGMIDELRIYNRALTDHEVGQLAGAAVAGVPHIPRERDADRLVLADGTVLRGEILNRTYVVTTAFGKLTVAAQRVMGLAGGGKGGLVRLVLIDGAVLVGRLAEAPIELKLNDASRRRVPIGQIRTCGYRISAKRPANPSAPATETVLDTDDGSRWFGRLTDRKLTIRSGSTTRTLDVAGVRWIQSDEKQAGAVTAQIWDGSLVKGRLLETVLRFALTGRDDVLTLPVGRVRSIVRPSAAVPAAVARRVEKLIEQLGAASFVEREDASRQLAKMGPAVRPLLQKHRTNPDAEIADRVQRLLQSPAAKATAPPAMKGARGLEQRFRERT